MKESYGTLSQTMDGLKMEGYTMDFNIHEECIVCHQQNTVLSADDFEIDKVYRFEGESNPDDEAVLYAIETEDGRKGSLIDAYGMYADLQIGEFMQDVEIHKKAKGEPL